MSEKCQQINKLMRAWTITNKWMNEYEKDLTKTDSLPEWMADWMNELSHCTCCTLYLHYIYLHYLHYTYTISTYTHTRYNKANGGSNINIDVINGVPSHQALSFSLYKVGLQQQGNLFYPHHYLPAQPVISLKINPLCSCNAIKYNYGCWNKIPLHNT